jgi:hypothetical protein
MHLGGGGGPQTFVKETPTLQSQVRWGVSYWVTSVGGQRWGGQPSLCWLGCECGEGFQRGVRSGGGRGPF